MFDINRYRTKAKTELGVLRDLSKLINDDSWIRHRWVDLIDSKGQHVKTLDVDGIRDLQNEDFSFGPKDVVRVQLCLDGGLCLLDGVAEFKARCLLAAACGVARAACNYVTDHDDDEQNKNTMEDFIYDSSTIDAALLRLYLKDRSCENGKLVDTITDFNDEYACSVEDIQFVIKSAMRLGKAKKRGKNAVKKVILSDFRRFVRCINERS